MRIAVFPSAFHPSLGGVEEMVRTLSHAFVAKGHDVTIVANRWPRDLPAHERFEGLDVFRFPFRVPDGSTKARITYPLTTAVVQHKVARLLRDRGVDVIHIQCIGGNALYAMRAARSLGVPLVATTHAELTMDETHLFQRSAHANRLLRRVHGAAQALTAVSHSAAADLAEHLGINIDVIDVIYNAADPVFRDAAPRAHPRPYVSALGRLTGSKGFDVLLHAFAGAAIEHDLLIAGDGPQRAELEALIDELGVSDRAVLLGRLDTAAVAALHAGAAAFVLPSVAREGLPLACIEAMTAGRAIVATRSGGVPELVTDGENGLLVTPGDASELRDALTRVCTNPDLRLRLGAAAARRAEGLTWPGLADEYLGVFRSAAKRAKTPG